MRKALEAGASAYVLKSGASDELLKAIEAARGGESYISPGFDRSLIASVRNWPEESSQAVLELTRRQRQILELISDGRQNKEISQILNVPVKTVEFHLGRLMTKLGVHTVAELTRFAVQEGLTGRVD